ncbi:uncharacterized protein PGTG_13443 [Puccinia graminis f. sp. tritici CRL 75-36-700-3]|uniref:Uncharacterized protein n=1 Tax=Puccinia graminis f. sp. tritici (strain CRL 75-36-700-3 / race SCCL) TaxID=418459 RepID=E3KTV4_PUCGT|nr:uncharacterized protein PGTG_13443 [Puccinia graminis f. sp. tritici CRL 75-36-700-3]EFP87657.2 hypothetical protein PGTG_13443 [Puccinia graminis f. sp. tritici CRL 75-36-700-3]
MKAITSLAYLFVIVLVEYNTPWSAAIGLNEICEHSVKLKTDLQGPGEIQPTSLQPQAFLEHSFETKVRIKDDFVYINNPFPGKCYASVKLDDQVLAPLTTLNDINGLNVIPKKELDAIHCVARLESSKPPDSEIKVRYHIDDQLIASLLDGTAGFSRSDRVISPTNSPEHSLSQSSLGSTGTRYIDAPYSWRNGEPSWRSDGEVQGDNTAYPQHSDSLSRDSDFGSHSSEDRFHHHDSESEDSESSSKRNSYYFPEEKDPASEPEEEETASLLHRDASQDGPAKKLKPWSFRRLLKLQNKKENK